MFPEFADVIFFCVSAFLLALAVALHIRSKRVPGRSFAIPLFTASGLSLLLAVGFSFSCSCLRTDTTLRVQADLLVLKTQIMVYSAASGSLPTTEQGLDALVNKPFPPPPADRWEQRLDMVPIDPWGQRYQYRCSDASGTQEVTLYSLGKDRVESIDDIKLSWTFK
ncbi:MAG: type II secretion system protein GspG [Chthoniobacteraceae bacterium]